MRYEFALKCCPLKWRRRNRGESRVYFVIDFTSNFHGRVTYTVELRTSREQLKSPSYGGSVLSNFSGNRGSTNEKDLQGLCTRISIIVIYYYL